MTEPVRPDTTAEEARDINTRVASLVMNWTRWDIETGEDCPCESGVTYFADWGEMGGVAVYTPPHLTGDVRYYFNPAESLADAWMVLEKVCESPRRRRTYYERLRWEVERRTGESCAGWEVVLKVKPVDICKAAIAEMAVRLPHEDEGELVRPEPVRPDAAESAREIVGTYFVYGDENANDALYRDILKALAAAEERGAARERERCLMDCSKVSDEASLKNADESDHYLSGVEVAKGLRTRKKKNASSQFIIKRRTK